MSKAPTDSALDFESSPAWAKMDLNLRNAWKEAHDKKMQRAKLECFIRTVAPMSADEKVLLKEAGFEPRTVVGTIISGKVAAGKLPQVAAFPFVKVMELAAPLSPK